MLLSWFWDISLLRPNTMMYITIRVKSTTRMKTPLRYRNLHTLFKQNYNPQYDQSETGYDTTEYDDATLNDEDYDYYYSSRIRRFHHNYYAPDFMIHSMRMRFIMILITTLTWFVTFMLIRGDTGITGTTADVHNWYTFHPSYWNSWNWYYGYNPFGPVDFLIISITLGIITITAVGMIPGMAMATAGVDVGGWCLLVKSLRVGITTVTITDIMPATLLRKPQRRPDTYLKIRAGQVGQ
ncbi:MAG: hypothetical protein U0T81_15090 [Saprospiraceae bacterium]